MTSTRPMPTPDASRTGEVLSPDRIIGLVWESAVHSFVRAILIVVFGSIAAGMLGSLWKEMIPSHPPELGQKLEAEEATVQPAPPSHSWIDALNEHRFIIVFGLVLIPTLSLNITRAVRGDSFGAGGRVRLRSEKVVKQVSENWFGLIVGNAFGAAIAAAVVGWVSQWTLSAMVLRAILAPLSNVLSAILGEAHARTIQDWFAWYGANQYRFMFWVFYLSAIIDDLGLPNFKTLGRWLGRRTRQKRAAHQASACSDSIDSHRPSA